jgi:hypothetical protein
MSTEKKRGSTQAWRAKLREGGLTSSRHQLDKWRGIGTPRVAASPEPGSVTNVTSRNSEQEREQQTSGPCKFVELQAGPVAIDQERPQF